VKARLTDSKPMTGWSNDRLRLGNQLASYC
jgi:hypothetical protein